MRRSIAATRWARIARWPATVLRLVVRLVPLGFLIGAAALAGACGGDPPPRPSETLAAFEILEEPSVCSAAVPTGTCSGPWAYHPWVTPCHADQTDPLCPNKIQGQCHPSCRHAALGFSVSQSETISCAGSGCCGSGQNPEAKCQVKLNAYRNGTAGNLTNVIPSFTITNRSVVEHCQYTARCNKTLTNARDGVNAACLPTFACELPGSCRLPSHPPTPGECGTQTTRSATATGLAFAQLTAEQKAGTPDCATLENQAAGTARLDGAIARSSAAHPFWASLPAPDAQEAAARQTLIKQAKLMFELGHVPSDRNAVKALYASAPGDQVDCGVSAAPPVSAGCRSFGTTHGLDGALGLCQRMLSTHVAPAVLQAEIDGCLELLNRPALAGTDACAVEYRTLVETVAERLLAKTLAGIQLPAGATQIAGLGAALARIDRWSTAAALAFASAPAALSDATGRVLAAFWDRAYAVGSPTPSFALGEAGSITAQAQLAALFTARIETDRQVLAAAFADPAPLDEAPLVLIVSDGLSTIRERLVTAAPLYDLACRFKGACSVAEANEATRIVRLVGAIGDDVALGDALTAATGVVRAPWRDLFTALRARRGALEAAYRKATARPTATLAELYLPSVPAVVARLAEQVSASFAMWNSYASHGVLVPIDGVLRTSLTSANVTAALGAFAGRRGILSGHRTEFQRARGDLAQTVLDRINNQAFQVRIDNESAVLRTEQDNLGRDLGGLMASQDQAEQELGSFLDRYIERASGPNWLPEFPVSGHPGSLTIAATAALGNGGLATSVPAVAVRDPNNAAEPWRLQVNKGDMLSFDITGAWSPSCALRKTSLAGPNGTRVFADPSHVLVGPEGFTVSWTGTQFEAKEHTSTDFTSVTTTTSICGNASASLLTVTAGPVPVGSLGVSASTCRQWQTGHSETDSNSSGSRFQFAANFAGGLRVATTPFPSFPAGALLLVEEVPDGAGTRIREAYVVRPNGSYVFPVDATVYLVVNDEKDPVGCAGVDTSPLGVSFVRAVSSQVAARALAETMAELLATMRAARTRFVSQGSVTASELSALQTTAYDQLRAACQCNLSAFPQEVRGMFDAWLAAELAALERATRIAATERALDSLVLRLKGLQDDLAGAQSASRLLGLLTTWQLGHVAFHLEAPQPALRTSAEILLDSASDMLAVMQIQYPQALAVLRQAMGPVTALRTFDWTAPYDEQVALLETLTQVVHARVEDARNAGGGLSIAPVALVFARPGVTAPVIPGAITAPAERSAAIWEPCGTTTCLRRRPSFTITPADVYGRPLVGLGCLEAAPVVQAFAVVAVNNGSTSNEDWNNNPRRADILRAADMQFPTENGILGFRTDALGGVLAPSRVRVLAAESTTVATTFHTFVRQAGGDLHGVSPFNAFTIDLGPDVSNANQPLKDATALVVFFDVQSRTATEALTAIGMCAAPPAGQGIEEVPPPGPDPEDGPPGGPETQQRRRAARPAGHGLEAVRR